MASRSLPFGLQLVGKNWAIPTEDFWQAWRNDREKCEGFFPKKMGDRWVVHVKRQNLPPNDEEVSLLVMVCKETGRGWVIDDGMEEKFIPRTIGQMVPSEREGYHHLLIPCWYAEKEGLI